MLADRIDRRQLLGIDVWRCDVAGKVVVHAMGMTIYLGMSTVLEY